MAAGNMHCGCSAVPLQVQGGRPPTGGDSGRARDDLHPSGERGGSRGGLRGEEEAEQRGVHSGAAISCKISRPCSASEARATLGLQGTLSLRQEGARFPDSRVGSTNCLARWAAGLLRLQDERAERDAAKWSHRPCGWCCHEKRNGTLRQTAAALTGTAFRDLCVSAFHQQRARRDGTRAPGFP